MNSGIFTGGVLLGTIVFGVLAGYALSILQWRGRGATFALALLVQTIPFQLLMIPLYVLIARNYGLADNYLGMILPFAINSAAVLIFRQYFLQLPRELFDAARIDGAGEFTLLWRIALPLVRPALVTALLLTFIGPWNEFLWPFLITKEASLQPLAVSLANYISTVAGIHGQPVRRHPRRRRRAGGTGRGAVHRLPALLHLDRPRLVRQGLSSHKEPWTTCTPRQRTATPCSPATARRWRTPTRSPTASRPTSSRRSIPSGPPGRSARSSATTSLTFRQEGQWDDPTGVGWTSDSIFNPT